MLKIFHVLTVAAMKTTQPSGLFLRVVSQKSTDVSEVLAASIRALTSKTSVSYCTVRLQGANPRKLSFSSVCDNLDSSIRKKRGSDSIFITISR
jgi:hypothetical protein